MLPTETLKVQVALVQTREWQAMMKKCNGSYRSKNCSKDGTSTADHHLVCRLLHELQAEPTGSGNRDGGPRHLRDAYNDSPVGQRYVPEFEKRWWRYARPVGGSWRMDET
jgi:hypothetical protein